MQAMGGMPMPGGWTMSMMWMRMPGHSWPGSAATFLAMWTVMMVAMMLPSLVPRLLRYRAAVAWMASAGYFFVWTIIGLAVFIAGVALAAIEMKWAIVSRAVPIAGIVIVVIAAALQFTSWKARQLSRCHDTLHDLAPFRHGIILGLRCARCCANWTAILLVVGMMDIRAMAVVTAAITLERRNIH
jgi:predicted metal-binding membrane protein